MGPGEALRKIPQTFFRFEVILATLLMLLPLPLYVFDRDYRAANCPPGAGGSNCRESISAYYDMVDPKWFYVPLSVAVMLFLVNGIIRAQHHGYNAFLGLMLLGVVAFDHESSEALHVASAVAFFGSSIILMAAQFAENQRRRSDGVRPSHAVFAAWLVAQVALFLIVWQLTTLFWAEWAQLIVVGAHYVLHSLAHADDEGPDDDTEPTATLQALFPTIYRTVAAVLRPTLGALWRWLTHLAAPPADT